MRLRCAPRPMPALTALVGAMLALALAAALVLAGPAAAQATAERRVALVLGIGAYDNVTRLANPPKDAAAVAQALKALEFDVVEGIDVDHAAMMGRLRDFSRKAAGADLALVFYAGHGIQVDNENWLLPRDAKLEDKVDLKFEAFDTNTLLEAMGSAKGRVLLLDACRDNPFREGFLANAASRSLATRGLARVNTDDTGTLIAFATSPGSVAEDGGEDAAGHSPFTRGLLDNIRTPGLELRQVLTRARQSVIASTKGRQTPWENSSLVSDIYLAGAPPTRAVIGDDELALTYWKAIADSSDPADFQMFRKKFPGSELALLADSKLKTLALKAAPPPPPPAPPKEEPVKQAPAPPPKADPRAAFRDCPNCPEMVAIPAGTFAMGAPADDAAAAPSERPVHRAEVGAFALARYPVTFEEWQACVDDGGCATRPTDNGWGKGRRPVINVTYEDATAYAAWLSKKTGRAYRLPSETEWEYAARAGTTMTHWWGEGGDKACGFANVYDAGAAKTLKFNWKPYACTDGYTYTAPVGSFAANPWNLGDMIGNVWQWVADCWTDDYSTATGAATPVSAGTCTERVLRGGSWMSDAAGARASTRMRADSADSDINIGFRVARDAP